ncbi:GNAT family N-acetyltransferase [Guyparkeria hydrothermalis]|uniref:GNAT family N-acetyltransferase n=1 Tax=Guyparkeria hydrothermalis TaxID=923 RepID=UPI002021AA78|nr:GNAT family N-acetyltransferase [Guyparkeria hydrothermalis]MCL7745271.1 GNAT family N-acetyltransferase [Guyparkeria hydrothermalis]
MMADTSAALSELPERSVSRQVDAQATRAEVYQVRDRPPTAEERQVAAVGPTVFRPLLGEAVTQRRIFAETVDYSRILFLRAEGALVGYLQFYLDGKGPQRVTWSGMRREFGWFQSMPRGLATEVVMRWMAAQGAYVSRLIIRPEYRGKGLGGLLLEAAIDHLREQGARQVTLDAWSSETHVQRFYQRQGFEVCNDLGPVRLLFNRFGGSGVVYFVKRL